MKKIIFDLDGTLLFMSKEWATYYQRFIDEYKLKITPEELYSLIGAIEKNSTNILATKDYFRKYLSDNLSIDVTMEMLNNFLKYYAEIPLLYTDTIYDVLTYLSKSYELIVYSNWFTDNQIERLKKYRLDQKFTKIYGWDILPVKPSKEGLATIIGDIRPENYIFVGDVIEYDLELPNAMGMETIFYNRKNIKQDKYREIFNIEDLKKIL